jgi:hypothetical protein
MRANTASKRGEVLLERVHDLHKQIDKAMLNYTGMILNDLKELEKKDTVH